jgi:tRNA (guanine26-N2/guanine27-N2)-dimethyltransferase
MSFWFPVEEVVEGKAQILAPKLRLESNEPLDHARSRAAVFYNPIMQLNRDTAVLALMTLRETVSGLVKACEPMCGSGVRGIRLALEADADEIVLGDLNPSAISLAEENVKRNNLTNKIRIRLMDANLLMNIHSSPMNKFDYVDVDPYGSPTPFLDSSIRCVNDEGIIALTATDMAPLCGVSPLACLRKYGGKPLRVNYSHEVALRLVIGAAVRSGAVLEVGAKPIFSFYADHYVRTYLSIKRGAKLADASLLVMGYIVHCQKCLYREIVEGAYLRASRECKFCGNKMMVGGPMWLGELANQQFLEGMEKKFYLSDVKWEPRLGQLLSTLRIEGEAPATYYNLDELCSKLGLSSVSLEKFLEKVKASGFIALRTHFDYRGLKTNANIQQLANLLKA